MVTNDWSRRLALLAVVALLATACAREGGAPVAESPTPEPPETETETEPVARNTGDGTLRFGTLLPETGSLAFLGPPEIAGVQLAVEDINKAGGVLGRDVTVTLGDSGDTTTDIANQTTDRLLRERVDAIIGAASSAVTFTVIDKIVGAGVIMFSPANTSKRLTTYDDEGLYFRTAPSDIMQGQVLGELVVADGNSRVALMALQDPYGEGLLEDTAASIEASGGQVVERIIYDPNAQNFDAEVDRVAAANPDAIVVIGFDESARILAAMIERNIGPADKDVYGADGNMSATLAEQVDPQNKSVLQGMTGTSPLPAENQAFFDRLEQFEPALRDRTYAAEAYDAVVLVALAALIAGTDEPRAVAEEINGVTRGGEKCMDFAACARLIADGTKDVDYDGASGPLEFIDAGEPGSGTYGILEIQADGSIKTLRNEQATL